MVIIKTRGGGVAAASRLNLNQKHTSELKIK